jgi:asparagine synthase (glutamine-hydrolysing)
MSLPPLSNLVAVHDPDVANLDRIERYLADASDFRSVWRPTANWLVGASPLPGGEPDPPEVRDHGFAFAEGRSNVLRDDCSSAAVRELGELVDSHPERLSRLPGDFGFLRFSKTGGATVVRSCGGLVPIYFAESGQRLVIGTRLEFLARFRPDPPELDPFATAVWMSGYGFFPHGRALLKGVSLVPRGHYAQGLAYRPIDPRPYWDPRPQSERELKANPEHSERLRHLLVKSLDRDLDPAGNNLLTLSGGVDSSSLGSLAAGTLGRPVSTLSLVPAFPRGRARELEYIESLRTSFHFGREWTIVLDPNTKLDLLVKAPPVVFPVMHPLLWALPQVHDEHPIRVLFGGEFGDQVCGAYATLADWVIHTSLFSLARSLRKLPMGPRDVLRWTRRRGLSAIGRPILPQVAHQLPDWARPELQDQYRDFRFELQARINRDRRPLPYLTLSAEADAWLPMNWEVASSLGIRRCTPFVTREIIELAYECHPSELLGPGTKKLIRQALPNDVPPLNLNRQDRGDWGTPPVFERTWLTPLPDELTEIVRREFFPKPVAPLAQGDYGDLTILVKFANSLRDACSTPF